MSCATLFAKSLERLEGISRVTGLAMSAIVRILIESVDMTNLPEKPDMVRLLAEKVHNKA